MESDSDERPIDCPNCKRHIVLVLEDERRCPYCQTAITESFATSTTPRHPKNDTSAIARAYCRDCDKVRLGSELKSCPGRGTEDKKDDVSLQLRAVENESGHPDLATRQLFPPGRARGGRLSPISSVELEGEEGFEGFFHPRNIFNRALQRSDLPFSRRQTSLLMNLFSEFEDMSEIPSTRRLLSDDSSSGYSLEDFMRSLIHPASVNSVDAELIRSLEVKKVTQAMRSKGDSCTICQEAFLQDEDFKTLPCAHQFHVECIDPWLSVKRSCPVCRQDIR